MFGPSYSKRPARTDRRRSRRLLIALIATGIVSLLAVSASQAAVPRSFFGLTAVAPTPADYEGMGASGAGSYRIEISWPAVQAERNGEFNWAGVDQRFRLAAAEGLRPLPLIFGTPDFFFKKSGLIRPPVKSKLLRREWQQFVKAVVGRYGPGGEFWKAEASLDPALASSEWMIWNEQNGRTFWAPKASPKEYARLLEITRSAVDTIDPEIELIVGGMYGYPKNRKSIDAKPFLKKLYKQRGAKALIDGVSVHPYSPNVAGVKRQANDARKVMDKAGDRSAKLYIGEISWSTEGPPGATGVTTAKKQATLLRKAYELLLSKRKSWRVESVFWFTWRDAEDEAICSWCAGAGLVNTEGLYKPAGDAFKDLIDREVNP